MSNVIALPIKPREERPMPEPTIDLKFGHALLERFQEVAGMPYHAPTVQVREHRGYYRPVNPLAKQFAKIARSEILTATQLEGIEEMGMNVEVLPDRRAE